MLRYSISIFSLLIGLFIYLVFRDNTNPFYECAYRIGVAEKLDILRSLFSNLCMPAWFIYSLPDGLWMFSFVLLILSIWDYKLNRDAIIWLSIAIVIGFIFEFTQLYFTHLGSFDWLDILFMGVGAIVPVILFADKTIIECPFLNNNNFSNE